MTFGMEWHNLIISLLLILQLYTRGEVDGMQPQRCTGGGLEELAKRQDCVCNSQTLVSYFTSGMGMAPSMVHRALEVMLKRINAFYCHEYIQLPGYLTIEMTDGMPSPYFRRKVKRKFLRERKKYRVKRQLQRSHRSKRQISLGYPTSEKWEEIIPHLPKHGKHYYVPIGSFVSLKCYAGHDGEAGIEDQVADTNVQFEWKHANGMEITAPYVVTDKSTGDLSFHSVRLSDTGIYNCTMKNEDEGDSRVFQSQLDVVAGPTYWLRFYIVYLVPRCKHKELLEIQRSVPNLVHKYACHFCSVRNVSMTCIEPGKTIWDAGDNKVVQLTLSMSAIGFEDTLASWTHNYIHCNLECQKSLHVKVLTVTQESLIKLFSLPIHVVPVEGETSVYTAMQNSYSLDLSDGCPPGFYLQYSLCFPCAPGEYSPTGPADCFPCDKGFFQPNPGSSACFHCQKEHTTMRKGSLSQMDCVLESASFLVQFLENYRYIVIWTGVGILSLFILLLLIICCCPNSAVGRLLRCVPCCGESCCGGENFEKEIPDDRQKLLMNESEFDSEDDHSPPHGKRRRSLHRRRMQKYREETTDGYENNDDHFSKAHKEKENVTNIKSREKIVEISKPLGSTKSALKQPAVPLPFRRRPCHCPATARNLRQQERELLDEQRQQKIESLEAPVPPLPPPPPPFPPPFPENDLYNDGIETSDGGSRSKGVSSRNPHIKLGNVLRKSKSLATKLTEQRHKLRRYAGQKSDTSSTLLSEPLSRLKNTVKNKMVKISESSNIYHPVDTKYKDDNEGHQRNKILSSSRSKSIQDLFRNNSSNERVKNTVKKFQSKIMRSKKR